MKLEIKFTEGKSRQIHWLLKEYYKSKANFGTLAKQAIIDIAKIQAEKILSGTEELL